MREPKPLSVRLVWGHGDQLLRAGDWVRYKIPSPNGNGDAKLLEFEGRVIPLPRGIINPQKYVPIARDAEEMVFQCQVDIVPIESVVSGSHRILLAPHQNGRKS